MIIRISTEASGYLVPNISDLIRITSHGACLVKKMFLLIYTDDKSDQTFFFGLIFPPVDKVIENAFAQDLGGIRK